MDFRAYNDSFWGFCVLDARYAPQGVQYPLPFARLQQRLEAQAKITEEETKSSLESADLKKSGMTSPSKNLMSSAATFPFRLVHPHEDPLFATWSGGSVSPFTSLTPPVEAYDSEGIPFFSSRVHHPFLPSTSSFASSSAGYFSSPSAIHGRHLLHEQWKRQDVCTTFEFPLSAFREQEEHFKRASCHSPRRSRHCSPFSMYSLPERNRKKEIHRREIPGQTPHETIASRLEEEASERRGRRRAEGKRKHAPQEPCVARGNGTQASQERPTYRPASPFKGRRCWTLRRQPSSLATTSSLAHAGIPAVTRQRTARSSPTDRSRHLVSLPLLSTLSSSATPPVLVRCQISVPHPTPALLCSPLDYFHLHSAALLLQQQQAIQHAKGLLAKEQWIRGPPPGVPAEAIIRTISVSSSRGRWEDVRGHRRSRQREADSHGAPPRRPSSSIEGEEGDDTTEHSPEVTAQSAAARGECSKSTKRTPSPRPVEVTPTTENGGGEEEDGVPGDALSVVLLTKNGVERSPSTSPSPTRPAHYPPPPGPLLHEYPSTTALQRAKTVPRLTATSPSPVPGIHRAGLPWPSAYTRLHSSPLMETENHSLRMVHDGKGTFEVDGHALHSTPLGSSHSPSPFHPSSSPIPFSPSSCPSSREESLWWCHKRVMKRREREGGEDSLKDSISIGSSGRRNKKQEHCPDFFISMLLSRHAPHASVIRPSSLARKGFPSSPSSSFFSPSPTEAVTGTIRLASSSPIPQVVLPTTALSCAFRSSVRSCSPLAVPSISCIRAGVRSIENSSWKDQEGTPKRTLEKDNIAHLLAEEEMEEREEEESSFSVIGTVAAGDGGKAGAQESAPLPSTPVEMARRSFAFRLRALPGPSLSQGGARIVNSTPSVSSPATMERMDGEAGMDSSSSCGVVIPAAADTPAAPLGSSLLFSLSVASTSTEGLKKGKEQVLISQGREVRENVSGSRPGVADARAASHWLAPSPPFPSSAVKQIDSSFLGEISRSASSLPSEAGAAERMKAAQQDEIHDMVHPPAGASSEQGVPHPPSLPFSRRNPRGWNHGMRHEVRTSEVKEVLRQKALWQSRARHVPSVTPATRAMEEVTSEEENHQRISQEMRETRPSDKFGSTAPPPHGQHPLSTFIHFGRATAVSRFSGGESEKERDSMGSTGTGLWWCRASHVSTEVTPYRSRSRRRRGASGPSQDRTLAGRCSWRSRLSSLSLSASSLLGWKIMKKEKLEPLPLQPSDYYYPSHQPPHPSPPPITFPSTDWDPAIPVVKLDSLSCKSLSPRASRLSSLEKDMETTSTAWCRPISVSSEARVYEETIASPCQEEETHRNTAVVMLMMEDDVRRCNGNPGCSTTVDAWEDVQKEVLSDVASLATPVPPSSFTPGAEEGMVSATAFSSSAPLPGAVSSITVVLERTPHHGVLPLRAGTSPVGTEDKDKPVDDGLRFSQAERSPSHAEVALTTPHDQSHRLSFTVQGWAPKRPVRFQRLGGGHASPPGTEMDGAVEAKKARGPFFSPIRFSDPQFLELWSHTEQPSVASSRLSDATVRRTSLHYATGDSHPSYASSSCFPVTGILVCRHSDESQSSRSSVSPTRPSLGGTASRRVGGRLSSAVHVMASHSSPVGQENGLLLSLALPVSPLPITVTSAQRATSITEEEFRDVSRCGTHEGKTPTPPTRISLSVQDTSSPLCWPLHQNAAEGEERRSRTPLGRPTVVLSDAALHYSSPS